MTIAYLDTSFLLAIVFEEPRASRLRQILTRFDRVFASDVLVAEAFSAAAREHLDEALLLSPLQPISLVFPQRSLQPELRETLAHGYLRGADLWHVGCALFIAGTGRKGVAFLSRDATQRAVARALGFATP